MEVNDMTRRWPRAKPVSAANLHALGEALAPAARQCGAEVALGWLNGVPRLEGWAGSWQDVVDLGHAASDVWHQLSGQREVVVDLGAPQASTRAATDPVVPPVMIPPTGTQVLVVGGGIAGLVVALKLAVLGNDVTVIEAGASWGGRTTSWNNGMVHSGFDPAPGTAKARHNVAGNRAWDRLADDLGVALRRAGSVVVALDEAADARIESYAARAQANGVPGVAIWTGDDLRGVEPRLSPQIRRGLVTPTTGFVEPLDVCRAAARGIRAAGGRVVLGVGLTGVVAEAGQVVGATTTAGDIACRVLVNAAGVQADQVAELAGVRTFSLHPRRGTLVIVEDDHANPYHYCVGPVPGPYTKGGGVTLRPSGTLSLGPSAVEQPGRDQAVATADEVQEILEQSYRIYPDLDVAQVVALGAQLRAASYGEDFVIGPAPGLAGFYNVAGMQSPGVASIPSVANQVAADLLELGAITASTSRFTDLWRRI
jgi:glycerol-3-phosphate dehydrogenase